METLLPSSSYMGTQFIARRCFTRLQNTIDGLLKSNALPSPVKIARNDSREGDSSEMFRTYANHRRLLKPKQLLSLTRGDFWRTSQIATGDQEYVHRRNLFRQRKPLGVLATPFKVSKRLVLPGKHDRFPEIIGRANKQPRQGFGCQENITSGHRSILYI